MSKDGQEMSPTHVTLKACVKPIFMPDGYVNFAEWLGWWETACYVSPSLNPASISFGEVVGIQRWFQYLGSAEGFKTNITHSMEQDKWNMRQILIGRHHLMNLIGHHHLMNQNRHLLIPIGHNHQTTIGHHMNEVVPIGIRWTRVYIAISFWRNMTFSVLCEIDACCINW